MATLLFLTRLHQLVAVVAVLLVTARVPVKMALQVEVVVLLQEL
jgi:hypothetical protein